MALYQAIIKRQAIFGVCVTKCCIQWANTILIQSSCKAIYLSWEIWGSHV